MAALDRVRRANYRNRPLSKGDIVQVTSSVRWYLRDRSNEHDSQGAGKVDSEGHRGPDYVRRRHPWSNQVVTAASN